MSRNKLSLFRKIRKFLYQFQHEKSTNNSEHNYIALGFMTTWIIVWSICLIHELIELEKLDSSTFPFSELMDNTLRNSVKFTWLYIVIGISLYIYNKKRK